VKVARVTIRQAQEVAMRNLSVQPVYGSDFSINSNLGPSMRRDFGQNRLAAKFPVNVLVEQR
jgi:hypothetical protein